MGFLFPILLGFYSLFVDGMFLCDYRRNAESSIQCELHDDPLLYANKYDPFWANSDQESVFQHGSYSFNAVLDHAILLCALLLVRQDVWGYRKRGLCSVRHQLVSLGHIGEKFWVWRLVENSRRAVLNNGWIPCCQFHWHVVHFSLHYNFLQLPCLVLWQCLPKQPRHLPPLVLPSFSFLLARNRHRWRASIIG